MKNQTEKKYGDAPENVVQKALIRRRKVETKTEVSMAHDESNWLVSYADMMTLLFGFFVLLYSFSRVDEKKFEIIRKDVARYFGGQIRINPTVKKLEEELQDVISASGIDKKTQVVARDAELELRFNGSLHFIPGTARLDESSNFLLSKLIDTVKKSVNADSVSVEGHTDDSPISSEAFPSNWELSSARASTVVREFEKFGFDSTKLTAKGYGSTRPLAPNRDSKGEAIPENQESNRRVIITVAFNRDIDDAVRAMKTGEFVSADLPENYGKGPLVHPGEGEPTWNEKMAREISSAQEKLKLAEERLKDSDERARAAKTLADMQGRLKQVETKIQRTEKETEKYLGITEANKAARYPAAFRKKRSSRPSSQSPAGSRDSSQSTPAPSEEPTATEKQP
jgi:chemotaxis protein MotB